ncbi:MAG TPA: PA2169 family four-helix-bundle protein [Fluviicola sp.]|nr:PA2169 family four-helix-bundle protein [Fluviicola sp.]
MGHEQTVDALNKLVQINNERIEGYETAMGETDESDLRKMFDLFAKTSEKNVAELSAEIRRIGGAPTDRGKITGTFFRVWMDVKAALTGKNRKFILDSCEYGEDAAIDTYETVLEECSVNLSQDQQTMIKAQLALLKADHNTVKSMRDAVK